MGVEEIDSKKEYTLRRYYNKDSGQTAEVKLDPNTGQAINVEIFKKGIKHPVEEIKFDPKTKKLISISRRDDDGNIVDFKGDIRPPEPGSLQEMVQNTQNDMQKIKDIEDMLKQQGYNLKIEN